MTQLRIAATREHLEDVNAFVEEQLEALDCSMKATMQLMVAVEELFINIASYAYGEGTGDALVEVGREADKILVRFTDEGTPFNPLAKLDPDLTLPVQERPIGGLGVFMVKKTMDLFTYSREEDKNIVTIGKIT